MENHPIPQDITGFQFKLIGDMTLKQFAYLAGGTIFAWITISAPISLFLRLPIASLFVLFGISFAFLSIAGRPVDLMILNFLRATFSPTKYVYESPSLSLAFAPLKKEVEEISFESPQNELDKNLPAGRQERFDFFHMLSQMLHPQHDATVSQRPVDESYSHPYVVSVHVQGEKKEEPRHEREKDEKKEKVEANKLENQEGILQERLKQAVQIEHQSEGTKNYEDAHKKVLEIEKLLNETLASKQSLEREIQALKKQLEQQNKDVYTPSAAPASVKTPNVRTIANKAQGKTAGLPTLPEFPNMIVGIIKDPRGNPIPNILVEVKDMDGNPVRAFKTNLLGQFQASTPLSNGTYTIDFEDTSGMNKFDSIKFEAKGDIILPIEIISIDTREELRKSLFTN